MKDYDLLLLPASPSIAPKFKDSSDKLNFDYLIADNHLALENFSGIPSLTIPLGFKLDMPYGINISSNILQEEKLLGFAREIEKITGLKNLSVKNFKELEKEAL